MPSRGFASVATIALTVVGLGCRGRAPAAPPAPPVTVAAVAERDVTDWDEFTGRLEAVDAVEVRPRAAGYITRVAFVEGSEVRQGAVLFEIDRRPYEAQLAGAEAELERARTTAALATRDVARGQRLVAIQAISREEFDGRATAEAQDAAAVRAAEAAVATARLNLEWSDAEVTVGNLVQAGPPTATLLTTVVTLDPIYAYFDGDEQTYLKYLARTRVAGRDAHEPVYIGLANEEGFPHKGYLDFVDNQLNPQTGTIRARAVLSNRDRRFTPGLFARIKFMDSDRYRAALIVDRAVGTDQDKKFVLALKPDSTVEYRVVQLGRLVDGLRVVTAGLKPGDEIVINGLQRVRPGMKVAATVAPMAADTTALAAAR